MGQGDGSVAGHSVVVGRDERERARQHSSRCPFCYLRFVGRFSTPRLFVAASRNSAYVVGVDDAREMTEKLRQMTTVALEALSNLPERGMDEAAVAPLTLNRSPSGTSLDLRVPIGTGVKDKSVCGGLVVRRPKTGEELS